MLPCPIDVQEFASGARIVLAVETVAHDDGHPCRYSLWGFVFVSVSLCLHLGQYSPMCGGALNEETPREVLGLSGPLCVIAIGSSWTVQYKRSSPFVNRE